MSLPVTLTVRGKLVPTNLDAARILHNETAGSQAGIAAARSLGDLSHIVFAPRTDMAGAEQGELLFIDKWVDAAGIGTFFSNPEVGKQGGRMFSTKDASVWTPATGSFSYSLPAPRHETRFVGLARGTVASIEKAIETFARAGEKAIRTARLRGIISHELFVKLGAPNEPLELLGLDLWSDLAGMREHYSDATHMQALGPAFTARPATSVWERAPGAWSEW